MPTLFDSIHDALADLAAGKPVIVVDDETRENEGDLIFAGEFATPELVAFTVAHTSGYLCVALTNSDADKLDLPYMVTDNQDIRGTAYTVTVDAANGISTGISAKDRARTIRLLADSSTRPADLHRPGHVVPLRARTGGVLERAGHTEATVDLMTLAGLKPIGALCEIVSTANPSDMARLPELAQFATHHNLRIISIADLKQYRLNRQVERVAQARLPLNAGPFQMIGYRDHSGGHEHIALVLGEVSESENLLVRVHSECLTGDAFGSLRCDCGSQLSDSLDTIGSQGRGIVIYLKGHEGRGIGLLEKLRAYHLQDSGADTVDANLQLGLPIDTRDYSVAAQILTDLKVRSIQLLTGNPAKAESLEAYGIRISSCIPIPTIITPDNERYIRSKAERLGHRIIEVDNHKLENQITIQQNISTNNNAESSDSHSERQPIEITGTVVRGDERGRKLGWPTANLALDDTSNTLPDGVYSGIARLQTAEGNHIKYAAAISVGTNPTFAGDDSRFEVHILDFDGNIYGQKLTILPITLIRPTLTFNSASSLVDQIQSDIDLIRKATHELLIRESHWPLPNSINIDIY